MSRQNASGRQQIPLITAKLNVTPSVTALLRVCYGYDVNFNSYLPSLLRCYGSRGGVSIPKGLLPSDFKFKVRRPARLPSEFKASVFV